MNLNWSSTSISLSTSESLSIAFISFTTSVSESSISIKGFGRLGSSNALVGHGTDRIVKTGSWFRDVFNSRQKCPAVKKIFPG